jgi:hypothetical protein
MNDRELQKLREVVFERLVRDQDPATLLVQLARRLGPDQADQLIAEARRRIEVESNDPAAASTAKVIRERRDTGGGYWLGPIRSRPQAERITRTTAGSFAGFGALALLASVSRGQLDGAGLVTSFLLVVPSAVLWKAKSVIAAGFLVGLAGLGCLSMLIFTFYGAVTTMGFEPIGLGFAVVLLIPLVAALRAFGAARFLYREQVEAPEIAVFD